MDVYPPTSELSNQKDVNEEPAFDRISVSPLQSRQPITRPYVLEPVHKAMEHPVSVDGTTVSITESTTVAELKTEIGYGDGIIAICRDGDDLVALANKDRILECVSSKEEIQITLQKPPEGDRWQVFTRDEPEE